MKQFMCLTVPQICEPLFCQPVSLCQDRFEHLLDLDLADYTDNSSQVEIDNLVCLDQYWSLATGEIRCGQAGPVAVNTKPGWVLSGPALSLNQSKTSTSLSRVLRVDGMIEDFQTLDTRL